MPPRKSKSAAALVRAATVSPVLAFGPNGSLTLTTPNGGAAAEAGGARRACSRRFWGPMSGRAAQGNRPALPPDGGRALAGAAARARHRRRPTRRASSSRRGGRPPHDGSASPHPGAARRGARCAGAAAGRPLCRRHLRRGRLHPGASWNAAREVSAFDRDPAAIGPAPTLVAAGRPAYADRGPIRRPGAVLVGEARGRRRRARHRRLLDAARRGGARLLAALDGPLDMRMGDDGPTAADIVHEADEASSPTSSSTFGEERRRAASPAPSSPPRRTGPSRTTRDLAEMIARVALGRPARARPHPATRVFQALRIAVNDELERAGARASSPPSGC